MHTVNIIENYHDKFLSVIKNPSCRVHETNVSFFEFSQSIFQILDQLKKSHKTLFIIGNGASCSMASHFAVDFTKNAKVHSTSFTDTALLTCFSNDYSYENTYKELLKLYMKKGDALLCISSSGKSPNIINATDFVSQQFPENARIGLSGFSLSNPLYAKSTHSLFIDDTSYGIVESAHSFILHMLLDLFIR